MSLLGPSAKERQRRSIVRAAAGLSQHSNADEAAYRLAAIIESSEDAIVSKDLEGVVASWNRAAERMFGYTAEEAIGKPISRLIIPNDRQDEEVAILDSIRNGRRIEHYETVRVRKDGSRVDISLAVSPVKDAEGRIIGASKIARDISERKRAEAQIAILAQEAEHRTKNILATVRATVHLTQADTVEEFKRAVLGRIDALSNVHKLFVESRWRGANLRSLIEAELQAYAPGPAPRVRIDGPDIVLEPAQAQALAVTIHELATNAAKYGALSVPAGQVVVEWSMMNGILTLRWQERHGPPVALPPRRHGFGTRLIENMVKAMRNGEVEHDWSTQGLNCKIGFLL